MYIHTYIHKHRYRHAYNISNINMLIQKIYWSSLAQYVWQFLFFRSAYGFMHMKIVSKSQHYILGQFSQPFDCIPQMIHHYSMHKLPIKGAEHMSLLHPITHEVLWLDHLLTHEVLWLDYSHWKGRFDWYIQKYNLGNLL